MISYNHIWDWTDGNIRVSAWVEDYSVEDMKKVNNVYQISGNKGTIQDKWQPTGTYWLNQTQVAIENAAQEKKKKEEREALARKIQAEKDKRRRDMLKAEAERKRRI